MSHAPPPSPASIMDRLRIAFAIVGGLIGLAVTIGKGALMIRGHLKERAEERRLARCAEIDARVREVLKPILEEALQPIRESQQQIMLAADADRATWQERHEENIGNFATLKTEVEGLKERRRWPREGS